jgi:hypothetical protein
MKKVASLPHPVLAKNARKIFQAAQTAQTAQAAQ